MKGKPRCPGNEKKGICCLFQGIHDKQIHHYISSPLVAEISKKNLPFLEAPKVFFVSSCVVLQSTAKQNINRNHQVITDPLFFILFCGIGVPARLKKYVMMRKRQAQVERQASISYSGKF